MDQFIVWWMNHVSLPNELSVMFVSMIPLIEERGGLIIARLLNMNLSSALFFCILGNIIPIPFILFGINRFLKWLSDHHLSKLAEWIEAKGKKNKPKVDKYGFWGLALFVGIPLPGTGAWSGTLVASLFDMDVKRASISILLGVFLAAVIMTIVSYGVIGSFL